MQGRVHPHNVCCCVLEGSVGGVVARPACCTSMVPASYMHHSIINWYCMH